MKNEGDALLNAQEIGAWMREQGEADFYDARTPLTTLLDREGRDVEQDRSEAQLVVMAYLFAAGPHPANVLAHLYRLAEELDPDLLRLLPSAERRQLVSPLQGAHLGRVTLMLRGTKVAKRPAWRHDVVILETLRAAHQRVRAAKGGGAPVFLRALLRPRPGEALADHEARLVAMEGVLRFFFFDGPAPEDTIVRVYAIAKAQYPQHILNMTVRQLGALFGVTGAAWSWRIKQKYNRFLASRGAAGVKARFQKSDAACAKYAAAQQGNRNRAGGLRRTG